MVDGEICSNKREGHNKRLEHVFQLILYLDFIAYFHIVILKSWQAEFLLFFSIFFLTENQ